MFSLHVQAPALSCAAAQQAGGQAASTGEPVSLLLTALVGIPDTALLRACADAAAMRAPLTQVSALHVARAVMDLCAARHTCECATLAPEMVAQNYFHSFNSGKASG